MLLMPKHIDVEQLREKIQNDRVRVCQIEEKTIKNKCDVFKKRKENYYYCCTGAKTNDIKLIDNELLQA